MLLNTMPLKLSPEYRGPDSLKTRPETARARCVKSVMPASSSLSPETAEMLYGISEIAYALRVAVTVISSI